LCVCVLFAGWRAALYCIFIYKSTDKKRGAEAPLKTVIVFIITLS
jgi:hypothetical protein